MESPDQASTCTINQVNDVITDKSEVLPAFCQSLEEILRKGLKKGFGVTGLVDRDYWNCIEGLVSSKKVVTNIPLSISHTICLVQQSKKVSSSLAKGRLFLRIALNKGLLYQTLQCLLENQEYVKYWYKDISPLVNSNDKKIILEIMKTLKKKTYRLNPKNCSFLNETWIIPEIQEQEFVPCAMIGVTLFTLDAKCIILDVKPGSIAHECNIQPGDCLDELYGQVIDEKWSQRISQLKRKNQCKPVTAVFIKGRFSDGRWFAPIYQRYKTLCSGKPPLIIPRNDDFPPILDTDHEKMSVQHKFDIVYVGAVGVGKLGNCIYVQNGITQLLKATANNKIRNVVMQLLERDIIVTCKDTDKVVGKFSYTETSSCAIKNDDPTYFGFIAGNTTCSLADHFNCHVFKTQHPAMARTIIEGIGKGFDRTVYCV